MPSGQVDPQENFHKIWNGIGWFLQFLRFVPKSPTKSPSMQALESS